MASIKTRIIKLEIHQSEELDIDIINTRLRELLSLAFNKDLSCCTDQELKAANEQVLNNLKTEVSEKTGQVCDDWSIMQLMTELASTPSSRAMA